MDAKVVCTYRETYLEAKVNGAWTLATAITAFRAIREYVFKYGVNRVLVNVTELTAPETQLIRFETGKFLAGRLRYPYRVAAFGTPEFVNYHMAKVASNRGARVSAFTDRDEALAWLLEGISSQPHDTDPAGHHLTP